MGSQVKPKPDHNIIAVRQQAVRRVFQVLRER
jgi:hypothetical protein